MRATAETYTKEEREAIKRSINDPEYAKRRKVESRQRALRGKPSLRAANGGEII